MITETRRQTDSAEEAIRVCFIIDNLSRAGTEMQLLLLLKHLDRGQIRPYLCVLDGEVDSSRALEPRDVPTLRLGLRRLMSLHAVHQALRFWRYLKHNRIDVVQTYFPDSTRFAAPVAKVAGVRAVIGSRRNTGHWMGKWDARIAGFYNRCFIDKVVANCEAARQAAIKQDNASPDKVAVIPNGIDLSRFIETAPRPPKATGQVMKIGMVGNLRHVKGPDLLIRAARIVVREHPRSQFEIAGGGDSNPYKELIRDLGLDGLVCLRGSVSDVPAFLADLDVAVLPSRAEGLSNSLLEYMAAARPIVATAVGGNTEQIQDQTHGLVVPANDVSALATAITLLLRDRVLAERLGRQAKRRVQAGFSPELQAERFVALCRSLIGSSGRVV